MTYFMGWQIYGGAAAGIAAAKRWSSPVQELAEVFSKQAAQHAVLVINLANFAERTFSHIARRSCTSTWLHTAYIGTDLLNEHVAYIGTDLLMWTLQPLRNGPRPPAKGKLPDPAEMIAPEALWLPHLIANCAGAHIGAINSASG
eukprot:SAG31_NODE_3650_length_4028_cov_1.617205_4_plen_145_part_00